jgi:CheY-like chemotaxis protein
VPAAIIVDDYVENAKLMGHYLELLGLKILAIGHDGKKAVELYQKLRPHFVFLNVQMPEYDGYFALTKIKQFNPSAEIIMATMDTSIETKQKLILFGATDTI